MHNDMRNTVTGTDSHSPYVKKPKTGNKKSRQPSLFQSQDPSQYSTYGRNSPELTTGKVLKTEETRRMVASNDNLVSSANNYYQDALRKTLKEHDKQGVEMKSYKMNPDNRTTMWNMIEKF